MQVLSYPDRHDSASGTPPKVLLPSRPDIERILIIKWSAMGDVVISTAIMEDIRRAFPQAKLHLNAMPPWDRLFRDDPRFDDVFSFDLRGSERGWRGTRRWLRRVRAGRYDLVIDLQSTDRSRMLLGLLTLSGGGIRWRIGNYPVFPYNLAPSPTLPRTVHALDRMRAALQAGGIPATHERPMLHLPQRNRERAAELMLRHHLAPGGYALLLPGCQAAGHLKRWGAERYAALGALLHRDGIEKILIAGGPDEMDECRAIADACGDWAINLCGQTEILDLVPLSADARCIVANDTGTAHVASSTTTPMLVICGPTDPNRVKPIGGNVTALQVDVADLPCLNCYCKHPCDHHSCMKAVTPQLAYAELAAQAGLKA